MVVVRTRVVDLVPRGDQAVARLLRLVEDRVVERHGLSSLLDSQDDLADVLPLVDQAVRVGDLVERNVAPTTGATAPLRQSSTTSSAAARTRSGASRISRPR